MATTMNDYFIKLTMTNDDYDEWWLQQTTTMMKNDYIEWCIWWMMTTMNDDYNEQWLWWTKTTMNKMNGDKQWWQRLMTMTNNDFHKWWLWQMITKTTDCGAGGFKVPLPQASLNSCNNPYATTKQAAGMCPLGPQCTLTWELWSDSHAIHSAKKVISNMSGYTKFHTALAQLMGAIPLSHLN